MAEHHRLLLEASEEILILVDAQTLTIQGVNRAARELLGHDDAALLGLAIGEIECALSDLFFWDEVRAQGGREPTEGAYRRADGSILEVTKTARPAGPANEFFVVRANPVGQTQRIADELGEMGSRLSATLEATADGILLLDREDAILNMNRRFSEMWGLPKALLEAHDDAGIMAHMARQIETANGALATAIHAQDAEDNAFDTLHLRDGRVIELSSLPARIGQQIIGRVHSYRDATERYLVHQELVAARDDAKRADQAKTRFLATMSHEIRTPMNGILGMGQMLLMPDIDAAERQEYARVILGSGKTLLALLNDILDLSKVEAGRMDLDEAAFHPRQLLAEMLALMSEPASAKGLTLDGWWQGDPALRYRGDPMRIRQMLTNLIHNGIKFTDRGGVVVEALEVERSGGVATVEFSVSDTGIGIAEPLQELLFQPFSQVDGSATRRFGGTGLGLSIVRSLAALMRGSVGVGSTTGKGSRFWFRVQLGVIDAGEDSLHDRRPPDARPADEITHDGQSAGRILIVEDNTVNSKILEAFLGRAGYQFEVAKDGARALELVTSDPGFDLVLMDCQLPVMDGYEATRRIRAWESGSRRHIPIIAITGDLFAADVENCLAAGMDGYLAKPVDFGELRGLLAKWMPGTAAGNRSASG